MVDVPFDRPDDEPDRPREPDRPPDPPDRRPPWEEPDGAIERVISASGWRDAPASRQLPRPLRDVPDEVAAAGVPAAYIARADRVERDATERIREAGLRIDRPEAHDRYDDTPMEPNHYAEGLREDPDAYEVTAIQNGKVHLHNPWNHRHPDPLAVAEFRECFSRPDQEERRHVIYTTLR